MNDLQIFENVEFGNIRMVKIDGKPYAVGIDVARALEYVNPGKAVRTHCKGGSKLGIPSNGGVQETTVIPEGDIIRLITKAADQSKSENVRAKAEKFESWIFDEVIPQVLRTGQYKVQTLEEQVAQGLVAAHKIIAEKNKQIAVMQPKALFADSVSTSKSEILVGELAKLIKQNGVDMGEKRLFAWLREHDFLIKCKGSDWNMPSQYSMEHGLFRIKETTVTHADGHITVNKTPKVTGKGQIYFVNKFLGNRE